jgi:two-component system, OmpR family, response regulator RpaB
LFRQVKSSTQEWLTEGHKLNAKTTEKKEQSASTSTPAKRNEKVLIVDDEASIRRILETRFKMLGYETAVASDGEEAIEIFEQFSPDIVILDIMMPKMDGYGVTKEIRKNNDTPIIILTALGDVSERITGLELGADDYVVKPFSPKELEARVKSILRRTYGKNGTSSQKETNNVIQIGQIKIDTSKRQVFRKNERVRLTGMEFSLLELLVTNSGTPYSRAEILKHVWSYPEDHRIDTRVVDVHISRLRSKLENDISNPELILTARGIGYMFQKIN